MEIIGSYKLFIEYENGVLLLKTEILKMFQFNPKHPKQESNPRSPITFITALPDRFSSLQCNENNFIDGLTTAVSQAINL